MEQRVEFIRKCKRCEKPLPPGSRASKKYCDECAPIVNRERCRTHYKEVEKPKRQTGWIDFDRSKISEADKNYCKVCIYGEQHSWNYLCNFFYRTGTRRGCKAGVGCKRRELRSEHS